MSPLEGVDERLEEWTPTQAAALLVCENLMRNFWPLDSDSEAIWQELMDIVGGRTA